MLVHVHVTADDIASSDPVKRAVRRALRQCGIRGYHVRVETFAITLNRGDEATFWLSLPVTARKPTAPVVFALNVPELVMETAVA